MRSALWLACALALPSAWFAAHFTGAVDGPVQIAFASGAAIFGAGFLLSWTAEVAQLDVPRALALAVLALIAVLPEYAVDVYFAWRAGQDPAYTAYATANMTGGNRLLIGVGWAASVLTIWLRHRRRGISLPRDQAVEVNYLALATAYSFLIPIKGALRGAAAASIGTLISSTVNQWTLLVGALPAAFALSQGRLAPMVLDRRQREEILLTSAQSIFALVVISNFRFTRGEALVLFSLFVPQLFLTSPLARWTHSILYLLLAAGIVCFSRTARAGVRDLLPRPRLRRRPR